MDRLLDPAAVPDLTPANSAAGLRLLGSRLLALLESLVSALDGEAVLSADVPVVGRPRAPQPAPVAHLRTSLPRPHLRLPPR